MATAKHKWEFRSRFRRHAFGWKSQPAIERIGQAMSEIRQAARRDPVLAAEGAVLFLERVSPAIEQVDSSSGAIGNAVNRAIDDLVAIIAAAPANAKQREAWLERLWKAHAADQIPYIEHLAEHWGELCVSKEIASVWADRLLAITRMALSPDPGVRGFFHGAPACLSALFHAERYDELIDLLAAEKFWDYRGWAVKALGASGRKAEAVRLAESSRSPWTSDAAVDAICEELLLSSGLIEEAYTRYGLRVRRGATYIAIFRAIARKYPHKSREQILTDLVNATPGKEGKWFATAKDIGLYDAAIELARTSPCDPKTLARAARDCAEKQPAFATEAGCAALDWIAKGFGYEISGTDIRMTWTATMKAATAADRVDEIVERVRTIAERGDNPVAIVLGRELGVHR